MDGDDDVDVRVRGVQPLHALGRRDDGDHPHRLRARPLEDVDRGRGRVPRGQHRVEQDHVPLGDVGRQLHVVLDGLQRLLVPVEADEADTGAP